MHPQHHPQKSYLIAYLLFFTLGWLGAHRFYIGRWTTGLIYLLIFSLWGAAVILLMLIDFFLLLFLVKKARRTSRSEDPLTLLLPLLFSNQIGSPKILAPWAQTPLNPFRWLLNSLDNLLRIILFFIGPLIVMMYSLYISGSPETLILMIVILIFAGYIGPMHQVLNAIQTAFQNSPSLTKVPLLLEIIETLQGFYNYYFQHRPANVLYYILFPITGLISLLSQSAQQEFKLYKNILILVIITLIFDAILSYSATYPPYLDITDAIFSTLLLIFFGLTTLITALMPTISTCFKLRFSGKRTTLSILTTLTLLFSGLIWIEFNKVEMMPLLANEVITKKMDKELFRHDLTQTTEMFLNYHLKKLSPVSDSPEIKIDEQLTQHYRRHLRSLASEDEIKAFKVMLIPETQGIWLGIHYADLGFDQIQESLLLFLIGPDGHFYHNWQTLPQFMHDRFIFTANSKINSQTYTPQHLSWPCLIDDYPDRKNTK